MKTLKDENNLEVFSLKQNNAMDTHSAYIIPLVAKALIFQVKKSFKYTWDSLWLGILLGI